MKNACFIGVAFLLACNAASAACTKQQAMAAEGEAGTLRSWDALHASYVKYAACDDGAIGEGYSDSVTRLFAERWESLPALAALAQKDPGFEAFVLRHVDETVPGERLALIAAKARRECPAAHKTLCGGVLRATPGAK